MTASLNASPVSREAALLRDLNVGQKSFANKDFVKNISFLNQVADTHTAFLSKLQKGVDSANQNIIEQITGFAGDLFVLFAGLEPTGIELGDLKYIIQGLGALLGINPDTPFPLNLFEAAWNMFNNYIIPLDQFTDVIFDAILAWAEDLGMSPAFIESLTELRDAIYLFTDSFEEFFQSLSGLLDALGFISFGDLGDLLASVLDLFDLLALEPLKPVFSLLSTLGVPFIEALTFIVNTASSFLTVFSPLNAANLFGFLRPGTTQVPASAITGEDVNLVENEDFPFGSISTNQEGLTVAYNSKDDDGTGSARIVADGRYHSLVTGKDHNSQMLVVPGKPVDLSIFLSYSGYTGTGSPIELWVIPWKGNVKQPPELLTAYAPTASMLAWPGFELAATYDTPDDVTGIQKRVLVTPQATTGTFDFDDSWVSQESLIDPEVVNGLPGFLETLFGSDQNIINTIFNALTGSSSLLATIPQLIGALTSIPFTIISGVLGGGNIGESLMGILDAIVGGAVNAPGGTGASPADAFNVFNILGSNSFLGQLAYSLLGIRNAEPVANGLMATSDSNIPYTSANTYLEVTQAESLCVTHRIGKSRPLGVLSFLGYLGSGTTAVYCNVRKINAETAARVLVHHSTNIISEFPPGATSASRDWVFYQFPVPPAQVIGEDYEYQLVPVGGSIFVKGFDTEDPIPDHPHALVKALAAQRNETTPTFPASSIASGAVATTTKVMYIETGIDTGNSTNYHDPVMVGPLTESTTVIVPKWAVYVDLVVVGRGGPGAGGIPPFGGMGGSPGLFNATTVVRGDHFVGDQIVEFDITAMRIWLDEYGVTATAGAAGSGPAFGGSGTIGRGPKVFEYKGFPYVAGGDQKSAGGAGLSPGGGGAGGHWLTGILNGGGAGAKAGAYVRFRQDPVEGEIPSSGTGDLTPPTPPTSMTILETNPTGFLIDIQGGSD
jgi:hypothetical protein